MIGARSAKSARLSVAFPPSACDCVGLAESSGLFWAGARFRHLDPSQGGLMESADRLNFDEFDLLCRAADSLGPASCETLSDGLTGENVLPRAKIALQKLLAKGLMEPAEDEEELFQISAAGTKALS